MHLLSLLQQHPMRATQSIPESMLGCFKRRSIAFANGQTDTQTHVFWLQSRNLTIDLRLPVEAEWVQPKAWQDYTEAELRQLANQEGWCADTLWQDERLSWSGGTSLQVHNRWPEPAILQRVGDCMMEFAPSGAYVEGWRLKSRTPGPLVGLRLLQEEEVQTGRVRHRQGALIINGDWAGLVLGRPNPLSPEASQLRDRVSGRAGDERFLQQVFCVETSVGQGNLTSGYTTAYSTLPERRGRPLFSLEGFEFDPVCQEVIQEWEEEGKTLRRRYTIDTLESTFPYLAETPCSSESIAWFNTEQETLGRYLQVVE